MKRIIAIDYGDARTGVAVSGSHRHACGEALTIQEWNAEKSFRAAARLFCPRARRRKFVLGLPKNMDGTEGPRAEKRRGSSRHCWRSALGLPVILWDERRSTIEAHAILHAAGKKKKHRANVDAVAATLLLEGYLASPNR